MSSNGEVFEPSLFGAVARDWFRVAAIVTVCLVVGIGYALTRPVQYAATASVLLANPGVDQNDNADPPERFVANQAAVMTSSNVAREASRLDRTSRHPLGLSEDDYRAGAAIALSAKDSNLIEVTMSASSPQVAVGGVDHLIAAYRALARTTAERNNANLLADNDRRQGAVADGLSASQTRLRGASPAAALALSDADVRLLDQRNTLVTDRAAITARIEQQARPIAFYSPATTAAKSSSIVGGLRFVVLAGVLGALIGGGLAYLRAVRRPSFFNALEPGAVLDAPLLAELPNIGRRSRASLLPVVDEPDSAAAKAFTFGAAALEVQRSSSGGGRFLLTSASADSGQSITTANVGLACAASGLRTLVMDADLESRGLTTLLGDQAEAQPGWLDVILARASLDEAIVSVSTGERGYEMALLRPGKSTLQGGTFLTANKAVPHVKALFAQLGDRYDIVLIDAPSILQQAYAATLAGCADGVAVAVTHRRPMADQREVLRRLQLVGGPPIGYFYTHLDGRLRARHPSPNTTITAPPTPSSLHGPPRLFGQEDDRSGERQKPARRA